MYQITATYGPHASTLVGADTMARACDIQAELYRYYTVESPHDNTQVWIERHCETCTEGRVQKCTAPKRHANGYHGARCAKVCPTCKGNYRTRLDA